MHHASPLVDTRPPSVQLHSSAHHQRSSDPQRCPRLVSTSSRASTSRHRSADLCASGDAASSMCPRPPSTWQLCFIGNAAPSRCASCDQHTARNVRPRSGSCARHVRCLKTRRTPRQSTVVGHACVSSRAGRRACREGGGAASRCRALKQPVLCLRALPSHDHAGAAVSAAAEKRTRCCQMADGRGSSPRLCPGCPRRGDRGEVKRGRAAYARPYLILSCCSSDSAISMRHSFSPKPSASWPMNSQNSRTWRRLFPFCTSCSTCTPPRRSQSTSWNPPPLSPNSAARRFTNARKHMQTSLRAFTHCVHSPTASCRAPPQMNHGHTDRAAAWCCTHSPAEQDRMRPISTRQGEP